MVIQRRLTFGRLIFNEHFNERELNFAYIIKLITRGPEVCRHAARTALIHVPDIPRCPTIFLSIVQNHVSARYISACLFRSHVAKYRDVCKNSSFTMETMFVKYIYYSEYTWLYKQYFPLLLKINPLHWNNPVIHILWICKICIKSIIRICKTVY